MSIVQLACANKACRRYAEKVEVQADASYGHMTLRNEPDSRCDVCDTDRQSWETVQLEAQR